MEIVLIARGQKKRSKRCMGGRGRWTRGGRGRTEHNGRGGDGGHRERCRVCYTRWHCSNPHPRRQQGRTTEMVDARREALCGPGQIPRTSVSPSCTRYCFIFVPMPHHHFAIPSLFDDDQKNQNQSFLCRGHSLLA